MRNNLQQEFDGLLMENGTFYISNIQQVMKFKNRLNGKISIYKMPEYTSDELDEESDWLIAESLMLRYNLNKNLRTYPDIKFFLTDIDGTSTDAGMYYINNGDELKKFNTHDGKGFELFRGNIIKTEFIASENTNIVINRAKKLKIDFLYQGLQSQEKLDIVKKIWKKKK